MYKGKENLLLRIGQNRSKSKIPVNVSQSWDIEYRGLPWCREPVKFYFCFAHVVFLDSIVMTSLFFLFFVNREFNRFLNSRGGGFPNKQTGMLIVSLRGVNFGFWSRLGCSGQSANILRRQGLV